MPYAFANGAGTSANPYQVATAADLNGVRDYLTAHFIQTADIDLSGYTNWVPIGEFGAEFKGGYDGDNHNITGLTINLPDAQGLGLFYHLLGTSSVHAYVKNLRIIAPVITGYRGVAPLAGQGTFCDLSNIMVTDVTIESTDDRTSYTNVYAAGLLGYSVEGVSFSNCCVVGGTITAVGGYSGGLVGLGSVVTAENCYSVGVVIICGAKRVGGLAGVIAGSTITNCYAANSVTGSDNTGGLIGYYYPANCTVTSSYYDSTISGQSDTGKGDSKTTAEMKQRETFVGWDFTDIWVIDSEVNDGYPHLQVFENVETPAYEFTYGTGTEADPYQVATAADLNGVRDYLDAYFIQMADIDLSEVENWEPIGVMESETDCFSGSYDGNGYSVSNLTTSQPMFAGLFGVLLTGGIIENLAVIDCNVTSDLFAGGLVAQVVYSSNIQNCMTTGVVTVNTTNEDLDYTPAGGLIGFIVGEELSIENCFSTCTVSATNSSETYGVQAGGLIGVNDGATIINSYSIGEVTASAISYASKGGLVGINYGTCTSCYYDSETSGCLDDDGRGTPKTTAEIKTEATFVGWDFDTVWAIDPDLNDGYPYLQWQSFDSQRGRQIIFPAKFPKKYP